MYVKSYHYGINGVFLDKSGKFMSLFKKHPVFENTCKIILKIKKSQYTERILNKIANNLRDKHITGLKNFKK